MTLPVLTFQLDDTRYGVAIRDVIEVARAVAVTALPNAPQCIEGVVDAHGELVPVIDLRARFGLPPRQPDLGEHLVLVRAGARAAGFRADRAVDVVTVDSDGLASAESIVRGTRHLAGVARTDTGLVLIHDPASLLSQLEEEALGDALRAADVTGGSR